MSQSSFGRRQTWFRKSWHTILVKVLTQRVDWVAWASIQFYDARDAIDDACTTSSVLDIYIMEVEFRWVYFRW